MARRVIFIELNEINFEQVRVYAEQGLVPNLSSLIERNGISETISERHYEELEPWIQWVTAHTGLTFEQHGVFRLGDILKKDILQIWEHLEAEGLKVGAMSPMNAKNRCRNAAFFVPDPWTRTQLSAPHLLKQLYESIAQAVNDNAQNRLTKQSLAWLLAGVTAYARPNNYDKYFKLAVTARTKPWAKAMFLDLLLADIFIRETARKKPEFASLFVNAGAHIQHHYMFNSAAYKGALTNPEWYLPRDVDPVLEVYRLYDRIIAQIQKSFPNARIMVATGLHQDPHPEVTFYWRLKEHTEFLKALSVPFESVEPRMSRDFLIRCKNDANAKEAERILTSAIAQDGIPLFEVDNRGKDLFVMLTYPHDVDEGFVYTVGNKRFADLRENIAFVAIKNGQHNGIGYFIDTGTSPNESEKCFPLKEVPDRICDALGVERISAKQITAAAE